MVSINTNPGAMQAMAAQRSAATDVRNASQAISTGLTSDDHVSALLAANLRSEAAVKAVVVQQLLYAQGSAEVALAVIPNVYEALNGLREAVIKTPAGGFTQSMAKQDAQRIVQQIDNMSREAEYQGTNVIAGARFRKDQHTAISSPSNTSGQQIQVGGVGASVLNASAAGLGLAHFTPPGGGVRLALQWLTATAYDAAPPPTVILRTGNWNDLGIPKPEYPRREWRFEFFAPGRSLVVTPPVTASFDILGNPSKIISTIPVELPVNYTEKDARSALAKAMESEGFVTQSSNFGVTVAGNNVVSSFDIEFIQFNHGGAQILSPFRSNQINFDERELKTNTRPITFSLTSDVLAGTNLLPQGSLSANAVGATINVSAHASAIPPGTRIVQVGVPPGMIEISSPLTRGIPGGASLSVTPDHIPLGTDVLPFRSIEVIRPTRGPSLSPTLVGREIVGDGIAAGTKIVNVDEASKNVVISIPTISNISNGTKLKLLLDDLPSGSKFIPVEKISMGHIDLAAIESLLADGMEVTFQPGPPTNSENYIPIGARVIRASAVGGWVEIDTPTVASIPRDTPFILRSPPVYAVNWTGTEAGMAVLESATLKLGTIAATVSRGHGELAAQAALIGRQADVNLVSAGYLADADIPKEQARLLAAQIREQLATQALGIANQMPRLLLKLFQR